MLFGDYENTKVFSVKFITVPLKTKYQLTHSCKAIHNPDDKVINNPLGLASNNHPLAKKFSLPKY